MQINITISQSFADAISFARFAAAVANLEKEFGVNILVPQASKAAANPDFVPCVTSPKIPVVTESTVASHAPDNVPAADASPAPAATVDSVTTKKPKGKVGRPSKADIAAMAEASAPVLPAAGNMGGLSATTAPLVPAGPAVYDGLATLSEQKTYILQFIGRRGDSAYLERLTKHQNKEKGVTRFQDFAPEVRAAFVAELQEYERSLGFEQAA